MCEFTDHFPLFGEHPEIFVF